MTEYAFKSNVEMASEFIVSTCQMLPNSTVSDHMRSLMLTDEPALIEYSIACGSAVEIYIHPLNTCIGDIDLLIYSANELAFDGDFPALSSDISDLADVIQGYKIEPYKKYPGFVRLQISAEMIYSWKYKKYILKIQNLTNSYKTVNMVALATEYGPNNASERTIVSGPAITLQSDDLDRSSLCDFVRSVWCPQWPREAQTWPLRPRCYRWPTPDTISVVLHKGCHVVFVQHRNCRNDSEQWRYSFSVAEVILLQSWTKIQQIVYHLIRFFAKRELIQKDCSKKDEVLCTYHLKTLMLWTCEDRPPEWWNSSSVIVVCREVLKKLSTWLNCRHCPNYFIPGANLFHETSNNTILSKIIMQINEFCNSDMHVLCGWFVKNYILPFISREFPAEYKTQAMLRFLDGTLLNDLFEFRNLATSRSLDSLLNYTFQDCHDECRVLIRSRSSSGLPESLISGCYRRCLSIKRVRFMAVMPTVENDLCFVYYDKLLHILHGMHALSCGEMSYTSMLFVELVNTISMKPNIIRSKYHNFPNACTTHDGQFQFHRVQDLMKNVTGSNSQPEFQLIVLMSKTLLRNALEYDDLRSDRITPAALAYLASLHFATSEYQQAKRLCLSILVDQTPETNMEALNAGCLLFIDDVTRIAGLCVLHKKTTGMNIHYINRRLCPDLRLSPKVFANYLKVLSAERLFKHAESCYDAPDSAFPMDEYLTISIAPKGFASTKKFNNFSSARQIAYHRAEATAEFGESESTMVNPAITENTVISTSVEYALEHMISFYDVIRRDFGIQCDTADCYRALYLYKCRQYDEVVQLCETVLRRPELQYDMKELTFANVLLVPPLDSFFDKDVQSLLGFHTLYYYLSPVNCDMGKLKPDAQTVFAHFFAHIIRNQGNALSRFLLESFSIRCYCFLGRHFLAKYLKARCYIDSNSVPLNS